MDLGTARGCDAYSTVKLHQPEVSVRTSRAYRVQYDDGILWNEEAIVHVVFGVHVGGPKPEGIMASLDFLTEAVKTVDSARCLWLTLTMA